MRKRLLRVVSAVAGVVVLAVHAPMRGEARDREQVSVAGEGIHYTATAIIHSREEAPPGVIQRSTDIVELSGDLVGRLLYHPVSLFDHANGRLVNTGHQVFSGTILGSDPVLLHDDTFRFDVDLETGATVGKVFLVHHIAGPEIQCRLDVSGTGMTPEGNATVAYAGSCTIEKSRP